MFTERGGVFISRNEGNSWTQINNGLSNLNIWSLVINGDYIFAGTWSGVFRAKISDLVASSVDDELSSNSNLKIYPNRVTELLTIERHGVGRAELVITNTLGQTVYSGKVAAGEPNVSVSVAEYPEGIYLIHIQNDDGTLEFHKFVKSGK